MRQKLIWKTEKEKLEIIAKVWFNIGMENGNQVFSLLCFHKMCRIVQISLSKKNKTSWLLVSNTSVNYCQTQYPRRQFVYKKVLKYCKTVLGTQLQSVFPIYKAYFKIEIWNIIQASFA